MILSQALRPPWQKFCMQPCLCDNNVVQDGDEVINFVASNAEKMRSKSRVICSRGHVQASTLLSTGISTWALINKDQITVHIEMIDQCFKQYSKSLGLGEGRGEGEKQLFLTFDHQMAWKSTSMTSSSGTAHRLS